MGACATAVAGGALCSGEERGGRGENGHGRRGVSTGLVHVSRVQGWKNGGVDTAKQEVAARARACVRWPRASHPPGGRLRVTGAGQWARPLQCQIR